MSDESGRDGDAAASASSGAGDRPEPSRIIPSVDDAFDTCVDRRLIELSSTDPSTFLSILRDGFSRGYVFMGLRVLACVDAYLEDDDQHIFDDACRLSRELHLLVDSPVPAVSTDDVIREMARCLAKLKVSVNFNDSPLGNRAKGLIDDLIALGI